ncbi:MAG: NYN domain-containing protein [Acidimicrobiales bacterium]
MAVRYFTAAVRGQPASMRRQQAYWYALETQSRRVVIEQGRFQAKRVTCRSCRSKWLPYEEKETDVAIAVALVEDAVNRRFDTALVVSADGDLCPGVGAVRRIHPSAKVVVAFPPARRSDEVRNTVDASFTIAERKLRRALLPRRSSALVGTPSLVPASGGDLVSLRIHVDTDPERVTVPSSRNLRTVPAEGCETVLIRPRAESEGDPWPCSASASRSKAPTS